MLIKNIVLIFISFNMLIHSQSLDIFCGTEVTSDPLDVTQRGGRWLTASGELKVLVVFAKFQGDTEDHPFWPANGFPDEMWNFIDPTQQINSSHFLNLTNYFNQMSYYNFKVIGTAVGITTPYPKSHYILPGSPYPNRAMANKDALLATDLQVNYNDFDNWTYERDYELNNVPDGIIDMVIVIWRGIVFTPYSGSGAWSGEASLGGDGQEFRVENLQKIIKMGHFGTQEFGIQGSGVTVQYWGERSRERNFHVCIHEVAHWLINSEHPYNQVNYQFWGMLTLADQGICANSFEKEKLAWLNTIPIENSILAAPLSDFITTPVAYKYHPPNGFFNTEMYYFENHQRQSVYDNITSNPNDKGIFILHLEQGWYVGDCMRVLSSDGFWDWESPFSTSCWNNELRAFKKTEVNRTGVGHRDKIVSVNSYSDFLYAFINDDDQVECNDWLHGYGFKSAFTLEYNDVFSPWSNSPATTWGGQMTDFIMQVTNDAPIITVSFGTHDAINGKPSKPPLGAFHAGDGPIQYGWAYLAWGADYWDEQPIESDINWSELQRKINTNGAWQTVYSGPNRYWSDNSIIYDPENGNIPVFFRVRVRDNQNKWSVWSDEFDTRAFFKESNQTAEKKRFNQNLIPTFNELSSNYPNPFNPTTQISYSIKENGFVRLKVYDLLGSEVATLVNETKESGYHSVEFNASELPSGVYIYTLQTGDFISSKKMILMK